MTRADLELWAEEAEIELVFYDGYDDAILGVGQRFNDFFVVYDQAKVIDALMKSGRMNEEEALDYFSFNVVGGWVGEGTPCFVVRPEGM